MTVAEELRKHADLAIKEGGMYYSGEYLDAIARRAESEQAENAKLRELVKYAHECAIHSDHATCDDCERMNEGCILVGRMLKLGVEVSE